MPESERIPLTHVVRPQLPWRLDETPLTECGRTPEGLPLITRDDLITQVRKMGSQRTALLTCMTCLQTTQRWTDWDHDPITCLLRYMGRHDDARVRVTHELRALAILAAEHRDEFDQLVAGLADAPSLDDARAARGRAARRGPRLLP